MCGLSGNRCPLPPKNKGGRGEGECFCDLGSRWSLRIVGYAEPGVNDGQCGARLSIRLDAFALFDHDCPCPCPSVSPSVYLYVCVGTPQCRIAPLSVDGRKT